MCIQSSFPKSKPVDAISKSLGITPVIPSVGDRVEFTEDYVSKAKKGDRGTVIDTEPGFEDLLVTVKLDNGSKHAAYRYRMKVLPKESPKLPLEFKAGDRVEYTGVYSTHLMGLKGTVVGQRDSTNVYVRFDGNSRTNGVAPESITLLAPEETPEEAQEKAKALLKAAGYEVKAPEKNVSVELTADEGAFLRLVLGYMGGMAKDTARKHADSVQRKLRDAGFRAGDPEAVSDAPHYRGLYFKPSVAI